MVKTLVNGNMLFFVSFLLYDVHVLHFIIVLFFLFFCRREGSHPRSATESPVEQGEQSSAEFQISTPSAFSKLNLHRSFSPLVLSQGSWSSRWHIWFCLHVWLNWLRVWHTADAWYNCSRPSFYVMLVNLNVFSVFLTEGVRHLACQAALHPCLPLLVALVLKVLLSRSQRVQKSRWPTWTTECPARIFSRHCMTLSLDTAG